MLQAYLYLAETNDEKNRVRLKLCDTADYLIQGKIKELFFFYTTPVVTFVFCSFVLLSFLLGNVF